MHDERIKIKEDIKHIKHERVYFFINSIVKINLTYLFREDYVEFVKTNI